MTTIKQALTDYINVRRGLGFQLRKPASLLRNFVEFLQAAGSSYITTNLALRWATQPTQAEPACWAARLGMVRRFAIGIAPLNLAQRSPCEPSSLSPSA